MSFIFIALRANTKPLIARSFHTPFAVLGNSALTNTPSTTTISSQYEKQYDHPQEPTTSHSGHRTYVVSEPDTSTKHYRVPAGAYPASTPYTVTDEPNDGEHTGGGIKLLKREFGIGRQTERNPQTK